MLVLDPYADGRGKWRGDSPGTIRKRFQCFSSENSLDFCSSVTIYVPGEGSIFHNHPDSEELGFVISGSGILQDMEQNSSMKLKQGDLLLIGRGELHRILNNGSSPLILLLVCTTKTPMPEG